MPQVINVSIYNHKILNITIFKVLPRIGSFFVIVFWVVYAKWGTASQKFGKKRYQTLHHVVNGKCKHSLYSYK